jgi:hypothetical protein
MSAQAVDATAELIRSTIVMPNWTEQELHVVGARREVDRFIRTGFTRRRRGELDDLLHFTRLCPLNRGERKDTRTHESGVVLRHFRTRSQTCFRMITSWDHAAAFYARLARHWPTLAFACRVNGEMSPRSSSGVHVANCRGARGRDWAPLLRAKIVRRTCPVIATAYARDEAGAQLARLRRRGAIHKAL